MIRVLWVVFAIFWLGGIVQGGVSDRAPWAAPLFLVLAGALTLVEQREAWKGLLCASAIGFAVEQLGVHTGLPFGRYEYSGVLAPNLLGVPVSIAFAWLVLIGFGRSLSSSWIFGAAVATAADLVIDPLGAGPLHYWHWLDGGPYYGVPLLNFVGWFVTSAVILLVIRRFTPPQTRMSIVGPAITAFFTALSFEHALWLPGAIGCLLTAAPFLLPRLQTAAPAYPVSDISSETSPASR